MKLVLLFVLCGIAIAVAKPYGTNSTFLERKMIGGDYYVSDHIDGLIGGAASIQVNGEHKWTGGFYKKTLVITTANAAMQIDVLLKTPNPECTPKVCYRLSSGRDKCIPVKDVAVPEKFLTAGKPAFPFDPYDQGIILVDEQLGEDAPTKWNSCTDSYIRVQSLPYHVLGWSFEEGRRIVKFMPVEYLSLKECEQRHPLNLPAIYSDVKCLLTIGDDNRLQDEDLGAVIIHGNSGMGLLIYVSEIGKFALMSPFVALPGSNLDEDWIRGDKLPDYHNVRSLDSSKKY